MSILMIIRRDLLLTIFFSILMSSNMTSAETWPNEIMSQFWVADGAKINRQTRFDDKYILIYDLESCFPPDNIMKKMVYDLQVGNWKRMKYQFLSPEMPNHFALLPPEWGIGYGEYWGDKPTDLQWSWHETWEDITGNIIDMWFYYKEPLKNHKVTDPWLHPKPLACNLHVNEHYVPILVRRELEKKKWPDDLQLAVISTTPTNNAINVSVDREVHVKFNKPISISTLKSDTFTLYLNGKTVPGTLSFDGVTATYKPAEMLANNAIYSGIVTSKIKDNKGTSLVSNQSWSFTTVKKYIWDFGTEGNGSIKQTSGGKDVSQAVDLTPLLKHPFAEVYGEDILPHIRYADIQLSPKGRYLALSISGLTSQLVEQIWMVDLATNRVRLLTEPVVRDKVSLDLAKMYWDSEGTLAVKAVRKNLTDPGSNIQILLRANMSETMEEPVASVFDSWGTEKRLRSNTDMFEIRETRTDAKIVTSLHNVKTGKKLSQYKGSWEYPQWTMDDNYFVFAEDRGHGEVSIKGGLPMPKVTIFNIYDSSHWLRGFFAISPTKHEMAYIKVDTTDKFKIAIFNLNTRSVDREIPVGIDADIFAWGMNDQIFFTAKSCNSITEEHVKQDPPQKGLRKICLCQL